MTPGLLLLLSCAACKPATRADSAGSDDGATADVDGDDADSGETDGGDTGGGDTDGSDTGGSDSGGSDTGGGDTGAAPPRLVGDQALDDALVLPGDAASGFGGAVAAGGVGPGALPVVVVGAPDQDAGEALLFDHAGEVVAQLVGETAGEGAGSGLLVADIDGDGIDDLLVGARQNHDGGEGAGVVYVLPGPVGGDDDLAVIGRRWLGSSGDSIGGAMLAGDVDGDGVVDLVVGAGRSALGGSQSGAVYLLRQGIAGTDCGGTCDLRELADRVVDTIDDELAGTSLALGDLDGDGVDDLVVGAFGASNAAGAAYGLLGPLLGDLDLPADADLSVFGEGSFDLLGYALAVSDLDGDGHGDLLVGVPGDDDGGSEAGRVLAFGTLDPGMDPDDAIGSLHGAAYAKVGWSLQGGRDLDGDTMDDVVTGAPGLSEDAGATYLAYGPLLGHRAMDPARDARWAGDAANSWLGSSLHLGPAGLLMGAGRGGYAVLASPWPDEAGE